MFKKFICFLIFFLLLGFLERNTFAEEASNIELSYKILESYSADENTTLLAKLRLKNISPYPMYGVTATVSSVYNIAINLNKIHFRDINPGETVEGDESFTISFKRSISQDPPQKEIVWQVEYRDINGNLLAEEVLLK
jgi:hypothetical protein